MADLPLLQSGRVENVGIPGAVLPQVNAPQVDYVGLKAAANYQQTLTQQLDRLSSTLFGIAKESAQQAGMQYVADNPITDAQLRAAREGNTEPLKLGGTFNVYDAAVRKARAFEVSNNFEVEARAKLSTLLTAVEQGGATTEQVKNQIGVMMDGFSRSLANVDPEASLKFRATISTMGNTVLAKAAEEEIKLQKRQRLVKFDADFDNSVRLLEASIARGYWVDPQTQGVRSVEDLANVYRETVKNSALLMTDPALQKTYSDKFEAAYKAARISAVSSFVTSAEFGTDFEQGLARLRVGDVGKMKDVFAGMNYDDKKVVVANFMLANNQVIDTQNAKRAEEKRAGEAQAVSLLTQIYALPDGDPKRKSLANQLAGVARSAPGAVPFGVLKDLMDTNNGGNAQAEFNLINGIYNGTISSADQIWSRVGAGGINGKQALGALKLLNTEDRRDSQELDRGLSRLAGIPTMPGQVTVIDPKGAEFQRLQTLRANALEIQTQALRDGKVITPRQVLTQLETDLEKKRNSEEAKNARKQLDDVYSKKEWINGQITRETLPALKKKAGNDRNKLNELKRIEDLLNKSEGNQ